jgi:hypothetical protein
MTGGVLLCRIGRIDRAPCILLSVCFRPVAGIRGANPQATVA